jgi:regulator of protease activity HflC (stomatin/prohibitin superfamily)
VCPAILGWSCGRAQFSTINQTKEIIMTFILISALALVFVGLLVAPLVRRVIVQDGREALLFRAGRFLRVLPAGVHWVAGWGIRVQEVDVREATLMVAGQEVLTADQLTLKVSVVLRYRLIKVEQALRSLQNYLEQLHLAVQEALRTAVGAKKLDELLTQREQIVEAMTPMVTEQAERVGAKVLRLTLRDFMLSGELKQAYAETVKARLEGQASLERARGETAAIRHLLNATQLMEAHPGLFQLRYLQIIDQAVTVGKGHTLMVGLPKELTPVIQAREVK